MGRPDGICECGESEDRFSRGGFVSRTGGSCECVESEDRFSRGDFVV